MEIRTKTSSFRIDAKIAKVQHLKIVPYRGVDFATSSATSRGGGKGKSTIFLLAESRNAGKEGKVVQTGLPMRQTRED